MAFGVTPTTQPITSINLNNYLVGISKIIVGGTWIGMPDEDSGYELNWNPTTKQIMTGLYPGTPLGKLHLGLRPEISFGNVEGSLANLALFCDLSGATTPGRVPLGMQNAVQTYHSVQIYSTGVNQRIRRMNLYRCGIRVDGAVRWAHPTEPTRFPLVIEVYPDLSLTSSAWFGEVIDEEP